MAIIPASLRKKISVIDVIFLLLLASVLGFFLVQRLAKKTEWITVSLEVSDDSLWWKGELPESWYANTFAEGLEAKDSNGDLYARVTKVSVFDKGASFRKARIQLELKVAYDKNRNQYLYNYKPLAVGKPLKIVLGSYELQGVVTGLGADQFVTIEKKIVVRVPRIQSWIADSYKPGMEMRDSSEVVLARIEKVAISQYYEVSYSDILRRLIRTYHPDLYTAVITLTVASNKVGDTSYFVDGAAIKIGERIWFQLPDTVIKDAEIIEILE